MQKLPQIDQLKLEKLKNNLDLLTEMSTILLNIHENKYRTMKNDLNTYEKEVENYSSNTLNNSDHVRDLFFNEIFPIFVKNMNMYVAFKGEPIENQKDSISILNIPFLVKLTTKNMILHLLILTNYKSLLIENVVKIKEIYNQEMNALFNNLNFESLLMQIDKELAVNVIIKKQSNDQKFTNLQRVYEEVFEYMNSSFENQKFNEILGTMTDLTKKLRSMIDPKPTIQRDLKEIVKIEESEIDATQLAYFHNHDSANLNNNDNNIYEMINSLNGMGDESSQYSSEFISRVSKRSYSSSGDEELKEDIMGFDQEVRRNSSKKIHLSDLFKSLKLKLNDLQDTYYNSDINKDETKSKFDSTWTEIKSIYKKFDDILINLIKDTNKMTAEYFSPYEANADILTFLEKIDDENIYKYLAFDVNISKATSAIMNSLPFQTFVSKHINDCSITIQQYLREHEIIEKNLISNKVLLSSITSLQLNVIKSVSVTFPLINFLPLKMAVIIFELFSNFNVDKMLDFIRNELESKHYFVALCGFVLTPIEKLLLISEERDTKLFNNRKMIDLMQNSYKDTVKNLFKFIDIFIFQVNQLFQKIDFKISYYYNILTNENSSKTRTFADKFDELKKNKEISSISKEYETYPFSYESCLSSIFHNAVAHSQQFKQSLLLVQTFFGMVEPIYILSCLMKLNENQLNEILMYLIDQKSYENNNSERLELNETPKLLESFLIRFFIFNLLLLNDVKMINSTGEILNLEVNSKFMADFLILIKKKTKLIERFNLFGISFLNENSVLLKRNTNQQTSSEKVYTVKEEFFHNKTEVPNILDYLSCNTTEVKTNETEKFSNNKNFTLEKQQCLQIIQQLDQSILGGILIQTIEMNDFNYIMNNLNFKEKTIQINII